MVEVQPIEQPILDDVDRILSYDRLTEAIAIELGAERLNLLETLAQRSRPDLMAIEAAQNAARTTSGPTWGS